MRRRSGRWLLEPQRLGHIGDRVLECIAGQHQVPLRQHQHGPVAAVDVDVPQLDQDCTDLQLFRAVVARRRHDQRPDRRSTGLGAGLDGRPLFGHGRHGQPVGDDLTVGENLVAGDMIEMGVAQNHPQPGKARVGQGLPDQPGMRDRDVGVVDQRLVAIDDRIAGDAQ